MASSFSAPRSNSQAASISSSPLFIMVALSMVTFGPIDQFGCDKACSMVTFTISATDISRKGPPEAVRIIFSISAWFSYLRHWNIALCSESIGKRVAPFFSAAGIIKCPAATSVSLFANAIFCPASTARQTGASPASPTMAATSRSTFCVATSSRTFCPANTVIPDPASNSDRGV